MTNDLELLNNFSFTPGAREILGLARKEADRLNHGFVGTEHLLLGLIRLGKGVAVNVLRKFGLDLDAIRMEVEKQIGTGPDQNKAGSYIPFTPRVQTVLTLSAKAAKALDHPDVGTEHILLGLLREGDGVAARVLFGLDVNIEQTRQEILNELDPSFEPSSHPVAPQIALDLPAPTTFVQSTEEDTLDFTPRAQQALWMAREEAGRFRHNYAGTGHLLLGLIRLEQGVAVNVLLSHGLNLETVRLEVQRQVGLAEDQAGVGKIPYTPGFKKALARGAKWARSLNHTYFGTEHLLLGLLDDVDGGAAVILQRPDISIDRIRQEILKELDPNFRA